MMKSTIQFLIFCLLCIWELPQNLLGLLLYAIMKARRKILNTEMASQRFFIETSNTGVSLGWFVFWTPKGNRFSHLINDCRMHEYGHTKQSRMLGPVYLLVVGIPSIIRVIYSKLYYRKHGQNWGKYFNGFPENQADKLGGVINSEELKKLPG